MTLRAAGRLRRWCACALVSLLLASTNLVPARALGIQRLPDAPTVSTLAGSGRFGLADGPGATAEFMGPQGLAADAYGDVYVADTPAQRIRMVDSHGNVTTVAGSGTPGSFGGVAGGYRDGPAPQARFSEPTGLAVALDGSVYVADLGNRAVRKIADGLVTTVAGSPTRRGDVDGPGARASFAAPRGIAIDPQGRAWVADGPNGVREIAPDGVVSTLHLDGTVGALAVSVDADARRETLYVVTPSAVVPVDLRTMKRLDLFATDSNPWYASPSHEVAREGAEFVGPASAVAGLGARGFVYTDALYSTVHLVIGAYTRVLGAQPLLAAGTRGGGFADGPAARARYRNPMGIVVRPDGAIVVADTGNRRIRVLSPFDRTVAANDPVLIPEVPYPSVYRVAIVGDSYVWDDVARAKSIGQIVWDRLCTVQRLHGHRCTIEVYPVRIDGTNFAALASYVDTYLTGGLVNAVYVLIPTYGHFGDAADAAVALNPQYGAAMLPAFRALNADARASGTRLTALFVPGAWDVPNAMTYRKLFTGFRDPGAVGRAYRDARAAARSSGVAVLDLWPAFFRGDAQAVHPNLFGAWDHHYTIAGNAVVGNAIANDLLSPDSNFVP